MWFRIGWIVAISLICVMSAYYSKKSNEGQGLTGFFIIVGCGVLTGVLWALVARYTKHLIVDGALFDILVFLVWTAALVYFHGGRDFLWYHWAGLGICAAGFCMMVLP